MVQIIQAIPSTGRVLRRPQHSFQIRQQAFQIQPFALCPVLPGETLKNALLQARVVSDPIKNPLVGWWYEMYLFYVKHRDMPDSSHFQNMVLSYGYDTSPANGVAKVQHYNRGASIDWADQCQRAVIPHYFRDDGEAWNVSLLNGMPTAKINGNSWMDSVLPDSQVVAGGTVGATGTTAQANDLLMQQFQLMRDMKLTSLTYEEFLKSYGIRSEPAQAPNKPELLRFVRDWSYPSNTVEPTTGVPASAMSWSIAERADKDRFFTEPGFIYGCCVARPKIYLGRQAGAAASMLNDAMTWLPAVLDDNPATSLKKFTAAGLVGSINMATEDYWVDLRDLFLYGDQFVNFSSAATDAGFVQLPTAAMQKKYPSNTDTDALFKVATSNLIRSDGILSLTIAGSQVDHT